MTSRILFFGNSTLKDVTIGSDTDYLIYPADIKRTVNHILTNGDANFGDKYEIMNVLTEAVNNGGNPEIVASQMREATRGGRRRGYSSGSRG